MNTGSVGFFLKDGKNFAEFLLEGKNYVQNAVKKCYNCKQLVTSKQNN
jgi:PP-loop superfamily ATP-utilizing enzyme